MSLDHAQPRAEPSAPLPMPPGGTAAAAFAFDWASTPLGPMSGWPPTLRTAAEIVLGSNIPMMLAWGPDLLLVHNDSYDEILGDRRPALGKPLAQIWADDWDSIGPIVDRVRQGETIYLEAAPRLLKRQGRIEKAWLTVCTNPVHDEHGRFAGLFGAVTAVSSDARSERRVRESEERFRLIADCAPALMWVTRLDRRRNFVNRAYVDFLGIDYDQAVEFDWRTRVHPDDHDRIIAESLAGEASMRPFALEARYRRHDGEWRWIRSISQPRWGPAGEHIGFIGVAHDITEAKLAEGALRDLNETLERRVEERTAELVAAVARLEQESAERERAEEALRQAQKMEAVGRLTGGIAHDFNNLLTPVIGGLELIAAKVDDPRLRRLADAALESSRRGAKLTTQLLTFSRLQQIRIAPVAVNQVIDNLRHILKHTIGSGISIRTRFDESCAHALCDENQLENAILNLAINARDAMPGGGTLTIATNRVREPGDGDIAPGEYVCVAVADTGTGMPAEVAARAVEPFFSTKPFGKGTGLGLAQVYGIARQSGGTVRIDSREGEGTTVCILLPHADSPAASRTEGSSVDQITAAANAARILVVDDDPDVRTFLTELLDQMGHEVEAVDRPEAAIRAIERAEPDLALIDFAMPSMNGAQLARALRERRPGLPIAFVTGYAESELLEGALGSEVPVLRKPFGVSEMASLLAETIGSEPPRER